MDLYVFEKQKTKFYVISQSQRVVNINTLCAKYNQSSIFLGVLYSTSMITDYSLFFFAIPLKVHVQLTLKINIVISTTK